MTRLSVAEARKLGIIPGPTKKKKVVQLPQVQWDASRMFPYGIWIQIPFVPPSLNVWKNWHWAKQKDYKDELSNNIWKLAQAFKLPKFTLATVETVIYFPVRRVRDPSDNYNQKFLMDALVRAGILRDDRGDWVEVMIPKLEIDREKPRTEVFVWERK